MGEEEGDIQSHHLYKGNSDGRWTSNHIICIKAIVVGERLGIVDHLGLKIVQVITPYLFEVLFSVSRNDKKER